MSNTEITNNSTCGVAIWDPVHEDATLLFAGAETWPAGAVLGKVTGTNKYTRFDPGASTGEEIPKAVLTQEVTAAGAGDVTARPLIAGRVRAAALVDNAGVALTAAKLDRMRDFSIIALGTTQLAELDNQ